jgi:hypothetical protein
VVYELPAGADPREATFFTLADTAIAGVRRTRLELGESCLVVGLGPVGLMAVMAARANGAMPVVGVDTDRDRREMALRLGADAALAPDELPPGEFDVAIEFANGSDAAIATAIDAVGRYGRVLAGSRTVGPSSIDLTNGLLMKNAELIHMHVLVRPEHESRPGIWTFRDAWRTFVLMLRLVVDSQRLISTGLVPFAARIDEARAEQWQTRATTYVIIQRQLRDIGGRLGRGEAAVIEAANAVARLKAVPRRTIVEPRVLAGFQTLFDHIDARIADIIEDGIERGALLQRVALPRVAEVGSLIQPPRERFRRVSASELPLIATVRADLRPHLDRDEPGARTGTRPIASPGRSRAELLAAIIHRPPDRSEDRPDDHAMSPIHASEGCSGDLEALLAD